MSKTILTGIQNSGVPHLGNILGAIKPSIELSKKPNTKSIYFIADLHSLTSIKDPAQRNSNTLECAAIWIACGLDTDKSIFFRQSKISLVTELAWYLSCITPYPMLANAHSFKDKSNNLFDINAGLFTYPILMASDILLYDANLVPVGKDQKQHLEITRDIAKGFNRTFGDLLTIPDSIIDENVSTIVGTDGRKMSKSYNNTINIFSKETILKKNIMSIQTSSLTYEEPKNPYTCNVFNIYKNIANETQVKQMIQKYNNGNYGYGDSKKELLNLILENFKKERKLYFDLINNKDQIIQILENGEKKAQKIAENKIKKIRESLGY